jgi:membrane protease YdiL (CAAX protease family)
VATSTTQIRIAVSRPWRATAIAEVCALAVLLLSYIWFWQGTFPGAWLLVLALYFGIGIQAHVRRGESVRDIGVRLDNFPRAMRNVALAITPAVALTLAIGYAMGSWHFRGLAHPILEVLWMLGWATAQQYGLLCMFYRRLLEIADGPWSAALAAAAIFATMHAPNAFLMSVTVVAGIVACAIYRRTPNLLAIGIGHAAISYALLCALPLSVTHGLRVGPGYLALP